MVCSGSALCLNAYNRKPTVRRLQFREILVTTLILVGSIAIGAIYAGYTAYKEHRPGLNIQNIPIE